MQIELVHDVTAVRFDGFNADVELAGDRLRGVNSPPKKIETYRVMN